MPKPCHKNLPPVDFVYGKSCGYDPEGAKEVTMKWKFHDHTRNKRAKTDFKKLNKMCVKQALVTSKQFYNFRRNNNAKMNIK